MKSQEKIDAKAAVRALKTEAKEQAIAARDAEYAATMLRVGKLMRTHLRVGFGLHIFENEIWIGSPERKGSRGWPISGAHATVVLNGQITQRLTATRMVTLGVFALAAPKRTGNQTLLLKVSGPGYNISYAHQGKVTQASIRIFESLADTINTLAGEPVTPSSPVSTADELAKFADLRDRGILSEDEFAAKKAQLLG